MRSSWWLVVHVCDIKQDVSNIREDTFLAPGNQTIGIVGGMRFVYVVENSMTEFYSSIGISQRQRR